MGKDSWMSEISQNIPLEHFPCMVYTATTLLAIYIAKAIPGVDWPAFVACPVLYHMLSAVLVYGNVVMVYTIL